MKLKKYIKGSRSGLLGLFLEPLIENPLQDVRCLLQLPKGRLKAGCNLTAGIILLNILAGISICLYNAEILKFKKARNRERNFKNLLTEYYPWENEPIEKGKAVDIFWENARNPLAHSLGLSQANQAEQGVVFSKRALNMQEIKQIENSDSRPDWLSPTIQSRFDSPGYEISIITLYWGTFQLIKNLLKNNVQTQQSETFLMHLATDYDIEWFKKMTKKLEQLPQDTEEYSSIVNDIKLRLQTHKTLRTLHHTQRIQIRSIFDNINELSNLLP